MASKPEFHNLVLSPCCKEALQTISRIKEAGDALSKFLGASPFVLTVAVNIDSNDWDVWLKAMQAVPAIVKSRCRTTAQFELIKHPGGDLHRFWAALEESFK